MCVYREIISKPAAIFWLVQQEGHTILAMTCIMYVRTHGVVDRPIAYKHFSFFSVSSEQIFEQLP